MLTTGDLSFPGGGGRIGGSAIADDALKSEPTSL